MIIRDRPLLRPELFASPSRFDALRAAAGVLAEGWGVRGRRRALLQAALNHAVSVETWQSLAQQQGLKDAESIELLMAMVKAAAGLKDSVAEPPKQRHDRTTAQPAVMQQ